MGRDLPPIDTGENEAGQTTRCLSSARKANPPPHKKVEDRGLEPVPSSPQKTPLLKQGGAESGALFGDDEQLQAPAGGLTNNPAEPHFC